MKKGKNIQSNSSQKESVQAGDSGSDSFCEELL